MNLLTESQSWSLLTKNVFGKTGCPAELESMIGGLLSEARRSRDVWEHIGNHVRSAIAEKDEQFSNILSLSYNHLPGYLKPCFLYMGAFPEDFKVSASRLCVAEGFEEADEEAEGYLTSLVERNLLTVRQKKSNGKRKRYGIHDLLRDLCIRKAEKEKFLNITPPTPTRATFYGPRRLSAHHPFRFQRLDDFAFSSTRSFIWHDLNSFAFLSGFFHESRLVRVLDMVGVTELEKFPSKILQLVNLRYLALSCRSHLPVSEMSRFRNLQMLIVVGAMGVVDIPYEIWEMPELRCLKFKNSTLRYAGGYGRRILIREKMQTISTIQLYRLFEIDFLISIPNIKSLGLDSVGFCSSSIVDLRHLHKLEKLRCSSWFPSTGHFLYNLRFPPSLRKLTLNKCAIPHEFMTTLSHQQPHLQVLKIRGCVFMSEEEKEEEWEANDEDEFRSLQFLSLEDLDVVRWRADETNFPRLGHLFLRKCWALEEIPNGIGDIPTLQLIELTHCPPSLVASARKIQEVQQCDYDNYDLQLFIFTSGYN